jgi:hypothetical protein
MNIADFSFQTRQVVPTFFETILTAPNGNRFGIIYRSLQPAPDAAVFEGFKQNKQAFFIEVESVVTPTKRLKRSQKLLTAG